MDNDTKVSLGDKTWLERFIGYFDDPKVGAAGATTNYVSGKQHIEALPDRYLKQKANETPVLVSFVMMLRKEAVEAIEFFDELYEPGNCEDYDYCLQLEEAGWKSVIADSVWIEHRGSQTFKDMNFQGLLNRNFGLLKEKWGDMHLANLGVAL
jgi:GT2 family glycosyltransferase